jgi:hypothetical protein
MGIMLLLPIGMLWYSSRGTSHAPLALAVSASAVSAIPLAPLIALTASALSPEPPRFDLEKRNRRYWWCESHGGVPDLSGSNVLCLNPKAVIPIPGDVQ